MCYFFDRPDDEAPEDRLTLGSGGGGGRAASKSFSGHIAASASSGQKGEPAAILALA